MKRFTTRFTQIVSSLLSFSIVVTSLSLADLARAKTTSPALDKFQISDSLGQITDSYKPESDKVVVFVQDLHLHYPTQQRIEKILEALYDHKAVSGLVAIEGLQGDYDTSALATLPAGKEKAQLVDYFMKKGELSGHEAFAVLKGESHKLFGVDDATYYRLNRELYKTTLSNRKALEAQLSEIQDKITFLKKEHYTHTLRSLDKTEIYDAATAEELLNQKRSVVQTLKKDGLSAQETTLLQNLVEIDHSLYFLNKLLRQETTLDEVHYVAQRLTHFVELTHKLLDLQPGKASPLDTTSLEEVLKSAVDFYAVALMRDEPLATNTIALLKSRKSIVLVAGGFHTAGVTKEFKKAGIGYVIITPRVESISSDYHALYEARVAGQHVTLEEIAADFKLTPETTARLEANLPVPAQALSVLSFLFEKSGLSSWVFAAQAQASRQPWYAVRTHPIAHGGSNDLDPESLLKNISLNYTTPHTIWAPPASRLPPAVLSRPHTLEADQLNEWILSLFDPFTSRDNPDFMDLLDYLEHRLMEHSREFDHSVRLVVSHDSKLLRSGTPAVQVYDSHGLIIVLNESYVDEMLNIRRENKKDKRAQLGTTWHVAEVLNHSLIHSFKTAKDRRDWVKDEGRVLSEENKVQHQLIYGGKLPSGKHLTTYGSVMKQFFEHYKPRSFRSGWLFGRTGVHVEAMRLNLDEQSRDAYFTHFASTLPRSRVRTHPIADLSVLIQRVRGEFLEMPGLRLSVAEASRLWGFNVATAQAVLTALVDEGFLEQLRDGKYQRKTSSGGSSWRPIVIILALALFGASLAYGMGGLSLPHVTGTGATGVLTAMAMGGIPINDPFTHIAIENIPADFSALQKYDLKLQSIAIHQLKGSKSNAELQDVLKEEHVNGLLETSVAQALGSIGFAGGGKDVKAIADGNAVFLADESIRAYTDSHPNDAIVIMGDEGSRDNSFSLTLGRVYFQGFPGGKREHTRADGKLDLEALKNTSRELRQHGVNVRYFVGDALEVTNGLVDPKAREATKIPTNSWSLAALFDERNELVHDEFRIGGMTYSAPADAEVDPFDLPSVALTKYALAHGLVPKTAGFIKFMNSTRVMMLGPRGAKKENEAEVHRHNAFIQDAKNLQIVFPGLQVITPGDGDAMPRVIAALGLQLDGYRTVVFGRTGAAEATSSLIPVVNNPGLSHFNHTYVSEKATEKEYSRSKAYQYLDNEEARFSRLGIPDGVQRRARTADRINGKGILAMTAVTGANSDTFGETFANLFRRVEFVPGIDGAQGTIVLNTLLVTRDGNAYVVRTTLVSDNLPQAKLKVMSASDPAKAYLESHPEWNPITSSEGRVHSPLRGGFWGTFSLPGTTLEETGTWALAKSLRMKPEQPVITPNESYVNVPYISQNPTSWKTFLLAVTFPAVWILLAIMTSIDIYQGIHSGQGILITSMLFLTAITRVGAVVPSYSNKSQNIKLNIASLKNVAVFLSFVYAVTLFGLSPAIYAFVLTYIFWQSAIMAVAHLLGARTPKYLDQSNDLYRARWILQQWLMPVPSHIDVAAQRIHPEPDSQTGRISIQSAIEDGATGMMAGHSEARESFDTYVARKSRVDLPEYYGGDTDAMVNAQLKAGGVASMRTRVLAVGEDKVVRDSGEAWNWVERQLDQDLAGLNGDVQNLIIAYEPVYAIAKKDDKAKGIVRVPPTSTQIDEMTTSIRQYLVKNYGLRVAGSVRILYGGSVKPGKILDDIMSLPNVDGVLVGTASNSVDDFEKIMLGVMNSKPKEGRIPYFGANWKANKMTGSAKAFAAVLKKSDPQKIQIGVFPEMNKLSRVRQDVSSAFYPIRAIFAWLLRLPVETPQGNRIYSPVGDDADEEMNRQLMAGMSTHLVRDQSNVFQSNDLEKALSEILATIFGGYDIRGIADDQRGTKVTLSPEMAYLIGWALGTKYFELNPDRTSARALITGDNRRSTPKLMSALISGLNRAGVDVEYANEEVPTGATTRKALEGDYDIAVQTTGSHNPKDNNGFKITMKQKMEDGEVIPAALYGPELATVFSIIKDRKFRSAGVFGNSKEITGVVDEYIDALDRIFKEQYGDLRHSYRNIVDVANGLGTPLSVLLERRGVIVDRLFHESDGTFPNHTADPSKDDPKLSHKDSGVKYSQDRIAELNADLVRINGQIMDALELLEGVWFATITDGDGDRSGQVDEKRNSIAPERVLLVLYQRFILENIQGIKKIEAAGGRVRLALDVRSSGVIMDLVKAINAEHGINVQADKDEFIPAGYPSHRTFVRNEIRKIRALAQVKGLENDPDVKKVISTYTSAEASGHYFYATAPYSKYPDLMVDDGIFSALKLLYIRDTYETLEAKQKYLKLPEKRHYTFNDMFTSLPIKPVTTDIRVEINTLPDQNPHMTKKKIVEEVEALVTKKYGAQATYIIDRKQIDDGVRVQLKDGSWFLVRYSNTGAQLTLKVEAETQKRLLELMVEVRALILPYESVGVTLDVYDNVYAGQKEKLAEMFDQEKKDAVIIAQKLRTPLQTDDPRMAARFEKGGYKQDGYGNPKGSAIDGSFTEEGSQGYFRSKGAGLVAFQNGVNTLIRFLFQKDGTWRIRLFLKLGIGGQHTPFQGISSFLGRMLKGIQISGEYELGKDFEKENDKRLKKMKAKWSQLGLDASSKSGSTDESMLLFAQNLHAMLTHAVPKGVDGKAFADGVFNVFHGINFIDGAERKVEQLFLVDKSQGSLMHRVSVATKTDGEVVRAVFKDVFSRIIFETTDNKAQSRLAAFVKNSGLYEELGLEPHVIDMYDNVGGRWTFDLHMMTFLAALGVKASKYYLRRLNEGIAKVRNRDHEGVKMGDKVLDENITDIALLVPDSLFWFGKSIEQNFNESIWQTGFANVVAVKESDWAYQQHHYQGKQGRMVINISKLKLSSKDFNVAEPAVKKAINSRFRKTAESYSEAMADLTSTFYGMTYTVGTRLIARALRAQGKSPADVDLNDLDNEATKIVQENLFFRQPFVELGKNLLEDRFKKLQAKRVNGSLDAIKEAEADVQKKAKEGEIQTNVFIPGMVKNVTDMKQLAWAIYKANQFAQEEKRKFVPFIYLEGEQFQALRTELVQLGIEWVLQGTGDQHISYQQVLQQPQKYLPFIISFVPEEMLPGLPAIGFAKGYLDMISPHLVRDYFAEASYRALTNEDENGRGKAGGKGFFLRLQQTDSNLKMVSNGFEEGIRRLVDKKVESGSKPERVLLPAAAAVAFFLLAGTAFAGQGPVVSLKEAAFALPAWFPAMNTLGAFLGTVVLGTFLTNFRGLVALRHRAQARADAAHQIQPSLEREVISSPAQIETVPTPPSSVFFRVFGLNVPKFMQPKVLREMGVYTRRIIESA